MAGGLQKKKREAPKAPKAGKALPGKKKKRSAAVPVTPMKGY